MVQRVPVSGGKYFAIVDDDDFERVSALKWSATHPSKCPDKIYAHRRNDREGLMLMHRLIMGLSNQGQRSQIVDHINGDTLDNRKENLRVCNRGENMRNYRRTSGALGVRGIKKTPGGKYQARIRLNYVGYNIGTFDTMRDACIAYAFASQVFHGEFGSLPGHDQFLKENVTSDQEE